MSTGLIIAIVVVALILIAIFAFVLPRARRKAQVRARERELEQRREQVADHHRTEATAREREAEMAQRKAQMAQAEADKQRAEAQMQQQQADLHERGLADDQLVADHEREHFEPAMGGGPRTDGADTGTTDTTGAERSGRFDRESAAEDAPAETRRP
jgi:FtsZ-interacting cell division protein ZipA